MNARIVLLIVFVVVTGWVFGQQQPVEPTVAGLQFSPQNAEGYPIKSVSIILHKAEGKFLADSAETAAFYNAFHIKPGGIFRQALADLAILTIEKQPYIKSANYQLYNTSQADPVMVLVHVFFINTDETKSSPAGKGMLNTRSFKSFPVLSETDHSKLTFILNGGLGFFNESNALFAKGPAFTQGNPIADNPAVKGERFWGEVNLEPGLAGILRLGKSNIYGYGAVSVLFSGRNTTDIYSNSSAFFTDVERMYAGLLITRLGKNKKTNIDLSFGRQFYQLDDGFLISKFSGSANAGPRGTVYLNSRTAFEKTALIKIQSGRWTVNGFFLEPQELFKNRQSNTAYAGGTLTYNDNGHINTGFTYLRTVGGSSRYNTPQGAFAKKGMYILNPKLYIKDISGTGIFVKSEYAYQLHSNYNMRSNAWYIGAGMSKSKWKYRPSFYYRYAFMKGDDSTTARFEKFDPVLTGGLGNWVQGINFRKVNGNGNFISHRVEFKAYLSKAFEFSIDYFHLSANTLSNLGALPPIATLKAKKYGHEVTLTTRYFLNNHFMLLCLLSHAKPGDAIKNAFDNKGVYSWTSVQSSLFMFF
jgi:hypothetical protein